MIRVLRKRQRAAGFTLLEVLVVLVIVGVLFAIIASSWVAAMNRQRVTAVREQAARVIEEARADARRTGIARVVVFDNTDGIPRAAILPRPLNPTTERTAGFLDDAQINAITNWRSLGNQSIPANSVELSTVPTTAEKQIIFEGNGTVAQASIDEALETGTVFSVNVKQARTSAETNRCVVVSTLLGATRLAEGTNCPT
ncbi:MAG: prepilin-type N-terminal cleavage/methylation domain-containing protein [Leptolyngbyaceae cyanobacterium bins.349]|nr:prepilin-type N-terminal cleavage/methylation domain-containing protein [Leptolyngbyaceae cyanobacterium bins.349]